MNVQAPTKKIQTHVGTAGRGRACAYQHSPRGAQVNPVGVRSHPRKDTPSFIALVNGARGKWSPRSQSFSTLCWENFGQKRVTRDRRPPANRIRDFPELLCSPGSRNELSRNELEELPEGLGGWTAGTREPAAQARRALQPFFPLADMDDEGFAAHPAIGASDNTQSGTRGCVSGVV